MRCRVAGSSEYQAEQHREQRTHRQPEKQYTETQSGVGLHAAGEQLDSVLVHTLRLRGLGAAVLVRDGAPDYRLGAQAGEHERQYGAHQTRQETARDQTLLHVGEPLVAGETEQMPCVVHEFVHVRVTAEQRHRALVDADEVQRQQRQERGCRQPKRSAGLRKVRQVNRSGSGCRRTARHGHG